MAASLWGCLLLLGLTAGALATERILNPTDDLQQVIDHASPGDRLVLKQGVYYGNFVISTPVEIEGRSMAIIDGGGRGHGINVIAENVRISGLKIRNWGADLSTLDAGIFVEKKCAGCADHQ